MKAMKRKVRQLKAFISEQLENLASVGSYDSQTRIVTANHLINTVKAHAADEYERQRRAHGLFDVKVHGPLESVVESMTKSSTVGELKTIAANRQNVDEGSSTLTLGGSPLQEGRTLGDYGIIRE